MVQRLLMSAHSGMDHWSAGGCASFAWLTQNSSIICCARPIVSVHCCKVGRSMAGTSAASCIFRSEEHTSELQSLMRISYAVFCLKKKKQTQTRHNHRIIVT